MISMVALSEVDSGSEPRLGQTKDYKIGICCLSAENDDVNISTLTEFLPCFL